MAVKAAHFLATSTVTAGAMPIVAPTPMQTKVAGTRHDLSLASMQVSISASGRQDENENDDDRHGRQTKAEETILARGQIVFRHSPSPWTLRRDDTTGGRGKNHTAQG